MSSTTLPSTGCGPEGWREYWSAESVRVGSNWRNFFECSLNRLRTVVVRTCPTCGGSPCANADFCRAFRDVDRRKAQGGRPQYSTPDRPIDWSDSPHLAQLRRLMRDEVSLNAAWAQINRDARERYNEAPKATYDAVVHELRNHGFSQLKTKTASADFLTFRLNRSKT
jgi:hypothetical protein